MVLVDPATTVVARKPSLRFEHIGIPGKKRTTGIRILHAEKDSEGLHIRIPYGTEPLPQVKNRSEIYQKHQRH